MKIPVLAGAIAIALLATADTSNAQDRPASPRGEASTQIDGSWIYVDYGRPILRGRTDVFTSGDSYGESVYAGAPVWRAGANQSTRITTEADLMFGDATLPAGEYSVFVDLAGSDAWTLIFSNHTAKAQYRDEDDGLWGAYGYDAAMDVLRVPMNVTETPMSADQFTILFIDVTSDGGTLAMWWENTWATAEFMVGEAG